MTENKRNIFEELKAMGVLTAPDAAAVVSHSDATMLGKVQEAASKVTQASEALALAAKNIQEAVTGFSSLLAEAMEDEGTVQETTAEE